ncbi:MAG: hypothetical protein AAF149_14810 [Bacteroidota bacterium]
MSFQSRSNYFPIPVILLSTYFICIYFSLLIKYHGEFEGFLKGESRNYAIGFLIGSLGSCVQLSIQFAKEINTLCQSPEKVVLPSYYEFIGYIFKLIWGGITAVVFVLALRQGLLASVENVSGFDIKTTVVVSFVVGLKAFSILKRISGILDK